MELVLRRDTLAEAVAWSSRSISPRPAVAVLSGVRIEAREDGVEFSSYDYEVSSRVTVAAEDVTEPGVAVVDGKLLSETARALPTRTDLVTFATEDNYLHITCGSFKQNLIMMHSEEYPPLPQLPESVGKVDAAAFAHSISQVAVAASRYETLPLLTGISLEVRPDKLYLLATDRYRMALKEMPWSGGQGGNQDLVVKAKNLSDAAKNIATAGDVEIAVGSANSPASLIGLAANGRVFTSQINDGNYPDVRRLFPEPINVTAVVQVDQFIETAKRVAIVSSNLSNQQISLRFTSGQLEFLAGNGGENSASDTIPALLNGPDIAVSFNSRMLLEGLGAIDEPYARLSFKDEAKPVVITGQKEETGEDNLTFRYLIMPIRTSI